MKYLPLLFAKEFKVQTGDRKRKKKEKPRYSPPPAKKQKKIFKNSENYPVVQELSKLKKEVMDLKRQVSKPCIVFTGKDVKKTTNLVDFKKNIKDKFYVDIDDSELSNFHPVFEGMIARFNVRHEGGSYLIILKRSNTKKGRKETNQQMEMFANVKLSEYDKSICYFARKLKQMGEIVSFGTDWNSGKIFIQMKNNKKKSLNSLEDLSQHFSPETMKKLKDLDTYGMLESNHLSFVELVDHDESDME